MTGKVDRHAGQVAALLIRTSAKLVTAESCTGGGLAEILTRIPGSSAWLERGFVTYSNAAKQELLSVPLATLEQFGAVSEETANAMVQGAVENSRADYGVAITGIAGPGGGTEQKPVGTVCVGWCRRNEDGHTARTVFAGDRLGIRHQACLLAMNGLIDMLQKIAD